MFCWPGGPAWLCYGSNPGEERAQSGDDIPNGKWVE